MLRRPPVVLQLQGRAARAGRLRPDKGLEEKVRGGFARELRERRGDFASLRVWYRAHGTRATMCVLCIAQEQGVEQLRPLPSRLLHRAIRFGLTALSARFFARATCGTTRGMQRRASSDVRCS